MNVVFWCGIVKVMVCDSSCVCLCVCVSTCVWCDVVVCCCGFSVKCGDFLTSFRDSTTNTQSQGTPVRPVWSRGQNPVL